MRFGTFPTSGGFLTTGHPGRQVGVCMHDRVVLSVQPAFSAEISIGGYNAMAQFHPRTARSSSSEN